MTKKRKRSERERASLGEDKWGASVPDDSWYAAIPGTAVGPLCGGPKINLQRPMQRAVV